MKNAEKFNSVFGIYATELWAKPEKDLLEWLNAEYTEEKEPNDYTVCPYCHEDLDGYITALEKNCHAYIREGMNGRELYINANGWHGAVQIKYCPMCGRKLKR